MVDQMNRVLPHWWMVGIPVGIGLTAMAFILFIEKMTQATSIMFKAITDSQEAPPDAFEACWRD